MASGPAGSLFLSSLFLSLFFSVLLYRLRADLGKERTDQCIARCFLFGFAHPHYKNLPLTQAQLTPLFDPLIVSLCIAIKACLVFLCIFQQSIWSKGVLTLEHLLIFSFFLSAKTDQWKMNSAPLLCIQEHRWSSLEAHMPALLYMLSFKCTQIPCCRYLNQCTAALTMGSCALSE